MMETKDIIFELRTKKGLSQEELAEKIFVTRQAVSRWENGETVPNTETLKLLSKEFDGKMYIGAGTVLTEKQVKLTKQSGGSFIISPDANPDIIKRLKINFKGAK